MKCLICILIMLGWNKSSNAQQLALTFQQARSNGIPFERLDSTYRSAVHTDSTKVVSKSALDQQKLQQAYQHLIQALGQYLVKNNFKWGKKVR